MQAFVSATAKRGLIMPRREEVKRLFSAFLVRLGRKHAGLSRVFKVSRAAGRNKADGDGVAAALSLVECPGCEADGWPGGWPTDRNSIVEVGSSIVEFRSNSISCGVKLLRSFSAIAPSFHSAQFIPFHTPPLRGECVEWELKLSGETMCAYAVFRAELVYRSQ